MWIRFACITLMYVGIILWQKCVNICNQNVNFNYIFKYRSQNRNINIGIINKMYIIVFLHHYYFNTIRLYLIKFIIIGTICFINDIGVITCELCVPFKLSVSILYILLNENVFFFHKLIVFGAHNSHVIFFLTFYEYSIRFLIFLTN